MARKQYTVKFLCPNCEEEHTETSDDINIAGLTANLTVNGVRTLVVGEAAIMTQLELDEAEMAARKFGGAEVDKVWLDEFFKSPGVIEVVPLKAAKKRNPIWPFF